MMQKETYIHSIHEIPKIELIDKLPAQRILRGRKYELLHALTYFG
jgi:hypothetical protein